ncbi:MAG: prenyltransferase/squalene oxidase repeat-containing protein [Candidatus Melainabacteria bacterium]|nr:prenyltransferase/squalene oxidase repeat-containing protein [Candidatus Melainabacteria bacterium]
MAAQGNTTDGIDAALTRGRDYLLTKQLKDGSWPYKSGQHDPSLEATSWVSLALAGSAPAQMEKVAQFLVSAQNADGGYSTVPGAGKSSWVTGPVVLAMRNLQTQIKQPALSKELSKSIDKALTYLCDSRAEFYPAVGRLMIFLVKGVEGVRYGRGWPWDKQCFHWVEPTSYNLMALKSLGIPDSHKGYFEEIVEIAEKFILEHSCTGGGWNHGNNHTLGSDLPPYRVTTAEALLAVQEFKSKKSVQDGLRYLNSWSADNSSSMSLAWSILALDAYGQPHKKESAYLLGRQNENGSFGDNLMVDALACLAVQSQNFNILKYGTVESSKT